MKIYDCFTFFNELDLLEIRLTELSDAVDYFVIVEAKRKHNGEPKELIFNKNKQRYRKWFRKIIYVSTDLPELNFIDKFLIALEKTCIYKAVRWLTINFGLGRWKLENYQRNMIIKGLKDCSDNDMIMVSDADEIPRAEIIKKAVNLAVSGKMVEFEQNVFYYYLNGAVDQKWIGTRMCSFNYLNKKLKGKPQRMRIPFVFRRIFDRLFAKWNLPVHMKNAGWHFSYLGGIEKVAEKRKALAHSEVSSLSDTNSIKNDVTKGIFRTKDLEYNIRYVHVDKSFPKSIKRNKNKYREFIYR
jgi:beta-1,4-mannosyl-glycoprotein beta-1,4-N-acetylglucosaminyltransferase